MFYLTTHSTHFIYGYMASDIWLRTFLKVRKEIRCRHIGYYFQLTARVLLYAPSYRQDCTYLSLCYTSRGNSSMGPPHEGSIRRTLVPQSYISILYIYIYIYIYINDTKIMVCTHTHTDITKSIVRSYYCKKLSM